MNDEKYILDEYDDDDIEGYETCSTMSRSCIIDEISNSITFTCER